MSHLLSKDNHSRAIGLFQKNVALPPKRRLDFRFYFGKIERWTSRFIWTKILVFTRISGKSTQAFKIQTFLFPQSGFPGKKSKIASGIPDFFAYDALTSFMGGGQNLSEIAH